MMPQIILPQQVTSIGEYAFGNCTGLKDITINRNVNSIIENAFSYPKKLTIYGVPGTYAEDFAGENNITFIPLDAPAQALKLNKTEYQLGRGKTFRLTASITPEDSSDELIWTSEDESIVTVDKAGLITGVKTGTTNIVAMIGNIVRICEVTVYEPVTRVSLNATEKDMSPGQTFQLEASVSPSNATNKNVTWSSGDESIATVNEDGLVKAISFGTTEITVTTEDGGKTAICNVKVSDEIEIEPPQTSTPIPAPTAKPDTNQGSSAGNQPTGNSKNVTTSTNDQKVKATPPAKVKIKSAKNKRGRKLLVKWAKLKGVKGYQIQYSKNKKFKGKKSKFVKKTSVTLKRLTKKKKYYIRIRAYKMNGSKKVYGEWSSIKKVKITK